MSLPKNQSLNTYTRRRGKETLEVTTQVGTFELVSEARCHTCRSPFRHELERAVTESTFCSLAAMFSDRPRFAAASRLYPNAGVSAASLRRHFRRNHHPMFCVLRKVALDMRAERIWGQVAATQAR